MAKSMMLCLLALTCLLSASCGTPGQPGNESASSREVVTTTSTTPKNIVEEPDTDTRDLSEKVAEAIKEYCPTGTFIIESDLEKYQHYDGMSFVDVVAQWTNISQAEDVFAILGVVVHEETHVFQVLDFASHLVEGEQLNMREAIAGLFSLTPGESIPKSELMGETIPQELRTMRFEHYVAKGLVRNSNGEGVLGLLNELEAYHQEARSIYEVYELLKTRPIRASEYFNYFIALNSGGDAFNEMTFYILTYMNHLKEYKPDLYDDLLSRKAIWTAFKYNYEAFLELTQGFAARNAELLAALLEKGYDAELIGEQFVDLRLRIGDTTRGTGNDVSKLIEAMKQQEYADCLALLLSLG